jgi:hypothetical protein
MENMNSLAIRVLNQAIELLPNNQRSRYAEEWHSHFAELTSPAEQLWHALGCVSCAFKTQMGLNGLPEPAGFRIEVPGFGAVESDLILGLRTMAILAKVQAMRNPKFSGAAEAGWLFFDKTMHLMNEKELDRMDNYLAKLQPDANSVQLEFLFEGIKYRFDELPEVLEFYFWREIEKLR